MGQIGQGLHNTSIPFSPALIYQNRKDKWREHPEDNLVTADQQRIADDLFRVGAVKEVLEML